MFWLLPANKCNNKNVHWHPRRTKPMLTRCFNGNTGEYRQAWASGPSPMLAGSTCMDNYMRKEWKQPLLALVLVSAPQSAMICSHYLYNAHHCAPILLIFYRFDSWIKEIRRQNHHFFIRQPMAWWALTFCYVWVADDIFVCTQKKSNQEVKKNPNVSENFQ